MAFFRLKKWFFAGVCSTLAVLVLAIPGEGAPKRPRVDAKNLEKRIHELINKERAKHKLSRLDWNKALCGIARKHSRDMAKRGYFSHESPDGVGFLKRYERDSFRCAIRTGNIIHKGAENIFQNMLFDSITYTNGAASYDWNSLEEIARSTVEGWMESRGHRRNILTPHWRTEGIGVFFSDDGKVYITQNFC